MADDSESDTPRHNILLITCDQYRFPRFSYGADYGFDEELKEILGFKGDITSANRFAKFFPGLLSLRENAVLLANHTIAASACTPSRATIYTGQYGTRTGVTQTDGLFKNGDSPNFPWLAPDGIPTLGTWMRMAGYTTHYFGKWHVSNPPDHSLERYGFDDWEESYPEPHGAAPNNLGMYRDIGFTDSACTFLRRKGLALNYNYATAQMQAQDPSSNGPDVSKIPPWFAVVSFTNPHDIATYPGVIAQALPDASTRSGAQSIFGPLTVPVSDDQALAPSPGTMTFALNPLGLEQDCGNVAPTWDEDLSGKPSCQHEAAYKVGLGLAAKGGFNIVNGVISAAEAAGRDPSGDRSMQAAIDLSLASCIPFQLARVEKQGTPEDNSREFVQLYAWLHTVLDTHIDAVLQALRDSGQAENTIVVFLADHGEYAAAHGMMLEKWYTAYQEALHVPVVVQYPASALTQASGGDIIAPEPAQIEGLTSHIDILPTVLGLAGVTPEQRALIAEKLRLTRPVPPLPGVDLAPLINSVLSGARDIPPIVEPDGQEREGVLFITDDDITAPLPPDDNPQEQRSYEEFEVYLNVVDTVIAGTVPGKGPVSLAPGPVKQPSRIRAVRTKGFKLARYFDPSGREAQEWEMYDLAGDPNEVDNLVQTMVTPPTVRAGIAREAELQAEADRLAALLQELEARYLS